MTKILEVVTIQSGAFKTLIESLKEILSDVNIEFRKKEVKKKNDHTSNGASDDSSKNKGGMRIMAMNTKKTVLIHMKLNAENFNHFVCEKPKIVVGVNLMHFFRLIRTIDTSSILTLFMDSDETNKLGIKIEYAEKKQVTTYKLNLLDLDNDPLEVPPTSFDSMITLPSTDFHKLCRDMHHISDLIEIQNIGKNVILKGDGDIASQETTLGETMNGLTVNRSPNNTSIVQGKYELKHLVMFTKCTSLCPTIDIYMRNDYPLIIHYTVASLGDIYLCLTPVSDENDEN